MTEPHFDRLSADVANHYARLITFIPSIDAIVCKHSQSIVPRDALGRHSTTDEKHGVVVTRLEHCSMELTRGIGGRPARLTQVG
jgi:hypothetical protein